MMTIDLTLSCLLSIENGMKYAMILSTLNVKIYLPASHSHKYMLITSFFFGWPHSVLKLEFI